MTQPERRDQRRVPLDRDFTVSFSLAGEAFDRLPTPNVSAGGLCVMVPSEQARHFQRGAVLESMVLNHPSLPKEALRGEVRYTLGGGHLASLKHVGVGVMFLDPPGSVVAALNGFVAGHFGEG